MNILLVVLVICSVISKAMNQLATTLKPIDACAIRVTSEGAKINNTTE